MDTGTRGNDAHQALPRQARLRAEFAKEYPEIEPDAWMSAKELAGKLVERTHARRRLSLYTRTFDPRHFEFRGGEPPRAPSKRGVRTRATDR
jgi:hypothetical protein